MNFTDYTEEDKRLHDFVITHNRKLRDIKSIVSNIMWELQALTDAFEGFDFVKQDENNLTDIVRSFGFTSYCNDIIIELIDIIQHETRTPQKYCKLQSIAHKYNLSPNDLLKVAKTNFTELCTK